MNDKGTLIYVRSQCDRKPCQNGRCSDIFLSLEMEVASDGTLKIVNAWCDNCGCNAMNRLGVRP
jgi:hypothetical protein